jgi:hypothetical protein
MIYLVLIGCESDTTGERYEPGETCATGDFPAGVIANWLEIGVLTPAIIPEPEPEPIE